MLLTRLFTCVNATTTDKVKREREREMYFPHYELLKREIMNKKYSRVTFVWLPVCRAPSVIERIGIESHTLDSMFHGTGLEAPEPM